jgi:hypothetical protein
LLANASHCPQDIGTKFGAEPRGQQRLGGCRDDPAGVPGCGHRPQHDPAHKGRLADTVARRNGDLDHEEPVISSNAVMSIPFLAR